MHKTASPRIDVPQNSSPLPVPNQDPRPENEDDRSNPKAAQGVGRRDFIKRTGLAVAGLTSASTLLTAARRGMAAGAKPTEITFSSAKFFGKETVAEVVEAFNSSQDKIHVTYKELPPPSSSTEVHQGLVQQLAQAQWGPGRLHSGHHLDRRIRRRKMGPPTGRIFQCRRHEGIFPWCGPSLYMARKANCSSLVH